MTSENIEYIINNEIQRVSNLNSDNSIADGAMGVALFLIWYGRKYSIDSYINEGVHIIESRCQNLSSNESLDVHRGHVGLAMGILWLSSSKILTAPISDVLQQIDDNIFKNVTSRLNNIEKKHIGSLIDIDYYIALRLNRNRFS